MKKKVLITLLTLLFPVIVSAGAYLNTSTYLPPHVATAAVNASGNFVVSTRGLSITAGAGGSGGFTMDCTTAGTGITATYSSGDATSQVTFTLSATPYDNDTCTYDFVQPTGGWQSSNGVDLASISGAIVDLSAAPAGVTAETLRVDSGGTINWTTYDSAAYPAHNTYLGDNNDATYIYATTDVVERHGLADSTAGEGIASVDFCARLKSDNGTDQIRIYAQSGASFGNGSYFSPANGVWTTYCDNHTTDPNTGSAWTQAGINAATLGIDPNGVPVGTLYCADMWIVIHR